MLQDKIEKQVHEELREFALGIAEMVTEKIAKEVPNYSLYDRKSCRELALQLISWIGNPTAKIPVESHKLVALYNYKVSELEQRLINNVIQKQEED